MSGFLSEKEIAELVPSELCPYPTPIPTQIVSSDEYYPDPQNEKQRQVENRLLSMADDLGGKQGMDRRKFFQSAAGMAASFLAMNQVYASCSTSPRPRRQHRRWRRSAPTASKTSSSWICIPISCATIPAS
jgi:hypothetical protein